jgi:hypothetical protein
MRIFPCDYYDNFLGERGWGMDEDVRWNYGGDDLDAEKIYYKWDSIRKDLVMLNGDDDALDTESSHIGTDLIPT